MLGGLCHLGFRPEVDTTEGKTGSTVVESYVKLTSVINSRNKFKIGTPCTALTS
jgi:hypothetical protein